MHIRRKSYKTQLDVVLLLEWNEHTSTWEESQSALEDFSQGSMHIFSSPIRHSYITFTGEDRTRIEWTTLTDSRRINQTARGIPSDDVLKTIPYELMAELDDVLYHERQGIQLPYEPSIYVKEAWEQLTGESLEHPSDIIPEEITASKTPSPLPRHVQIILLTEAVRTRKECSIAMEPITLENGSVTSCGHIFTREALSEWLQDNNTCPECRENL